MSIMLCDTNAIYLAYLDLTTATKEGLLRRTDSGPRAWQRLIDMRDRLSLVVQSGKPYAAELSTADTRHDIGCAVLEHACRIHDLLGALPEFADLGPRADQVRATLNFGRGLTTASYVDTAATAARNRVALPRCAETLRRMPVAEGVDGLEVAELFIGGGEAVGGWLGKRADARAELSAARAQSDGRGLISEAREVLTRLRATIDSEVSWRDDLPDDLGAQIFAVLDAEIAAATAKARGTRASGEGRDAVAELDAAEAAEAAQRAAEDGVADDVAAVDPPAPAAPGDDVAPGEPEPARFLPRALDE